MTPMLHIEGLSKRYGDHKVLDGFSIDVEEGKILTLLGPSGCGKTTLLRIIAGLAEASSGSVAFGGEEWLSVAKRINVPSRKRNIGLVFQSYAIWPHLTVFEQIAYPLRVRKWKEDQIRERVAELLKVIGMDDLGARPATMLSGGQQQRVAMARALAPRPKLLLLDEPFSNLDVSIRGQLRRELKEIQRRIKVNIVLVTHDQIDAFTLSDQIAVMNQGVVEQIGSGQQIYDHPRTDFVRTFVGSSVEFRSLVMQPCADGAVVEVAGGSRMHLTDVTRVEAKEGGKVDVWFRPEDLEVSRLGGRADGLEGRVLDTTYMGDRYECRVMLANGNIVVVSTPKTLILMPEDRVNIRPLR